MKEKSNDDNDCDDRVYKISISCGEFKKKRFRDKNKINNYIYGHLIVDSVENQEDGLIIKVFKEDQDQEENQNQ